MEVTYKPRHRRQINVYTDSYGESHATCTCGRRLLTVCPRHYPSLYADIDAKHKAVA
jgi:hypothetical protein